MNKRDKHFIDAYERSRYKTLSQCYKTFSEEMRKAELLCRYKAYKRGGWDFRILSFNTFGFTCGWQEKEYNLHIETPTKSYDIDYLPF